MRVECSACGDEIGRMGIGSHWRRHKRDFADEHGREPRDNDEIREWLGGTPRGERIEGDSGDSVAAVADGQARLDEYSGR